MPKKIEFEGTVHEFPDDYSVGDIQTALAKWHPAPAASDPRVKLGQYVKDTISNVPGSAAKFAGNMYQAARHPIDTAASMGKVAVGTLQNMTPGYVTPERPGYSAEANAAGEALKEKYGSLPAIAESIRTDPVGVAADASAVAGGVSGVARGVAGLAERAAPRVAGIASDIARGASTASDAVNPLIATGRVMKRIPVPEKLKPAGLYGSALKPPPTMPPGERDAIIGTGIREGIPVSRGGFNTAVGRTDALNNEIAGRIADKSAELGPVVSPKAVASRTAPLRKTFGEQVNPNADLSAIEGSTQEFLDKHSTQAPYTKVRPGTEEATGTYVPEGTGSTPMEKPLTLSETQAEKQGTYRQLRKKYGELGAADVESQKNLARGLKEEIVARMPELTALNSRDSSLISLEQQLARFVGREGNKNVLGLIPAIVGTGAGMMTGHSVEGGLAGAMGTLAVLAMDNPNIKSRIAIALDRAKKLQGPATRAARGANAAAAISNSGRPPATLPPQ